MDHLKPWMKRKIYRKKIFILLLLYYLLWLFLSLCLKTKKINVYIHMK
jgi:hypothetical protein